ncbi:uncharacterized protein LOC143720721 [Siphateles boraxobius]|uniref:uncharacterized protein LOC143720721 n=1 Tax=Siphateles boraxobius TaxID=180520 RepID=UPI00406439DF
MFIYLLLLTVIATVEAQRVPGQQKTDSCLCKINSSIWTFPAVRFVEVTKQVQTCKENLNEFEEKMSNTDAELPLMRATLQNITARLKAFNYLHTSGLYNSLLLRQLNQELEEIHQSVNESHLQNPNKETHNLLSELNKAKNDVRRMYKVDFFNLETMKKRLRDLHNRAQTYKTIPNNFRSSVLDGTSGEGPVLDGTSGEGPVLDGTSGEGPVLDGTSGEGPVLDGTSGEGPVLDGTSGEGPVLDGTSGEGPVLDGTSGEGPVLDGTSGEGPVLDGTSGEGAVLDGTSGEGPVLDGTSGEGPVLDGTSGEGSVLDGTSGEGSGLGRDSLPGMRTGCVVMEMAGDGG